MIKYHPLKRAWETIKTAEAFHPLKKVTFGEGMNDTPHRILSCPHFLPLSPAPHTHTEGRNSALFLSSEIPVV